MTTESLAGTGLAVRVIPCLDVDDGRVVKGVNFENLRDAGDPVELAAAYDADGADELTFLDVTASSSGRTTMLEVVRRTAEQVFIPLTVGGGVRTVADVDVLLRAGADKVSINTAAIARPELLAEMAAQFGSQCIVLSVDAGIAARLKRNADGLFTAIVQERGSGDVLMVAWMDDEALARTLETREGTYFSRSRGEQWVKGATSGHTQRVHSVRLDCDGDTVLLTVDQVGGACHTGDHSCFDADVLLGPEG